MTTPVTRPRRSRSARRLLDRLASTRAVIAALVIGLALPLGIAPGSAAPAEALWMTPEHTASAAISAGTLTITQSGFSRLAATYTSGALSTTAPVILANTGTIPAPYTLRLGAQTSTALAQATDVRAWAVSSSAACTATATASGPAANWTTVAALTGTLAPGATVVYCVRSSLTQAQRYAQSGGAVTATAVVSAAQGSWTTAATATANQSVAATVTPGATTKVSETDSTITLAWTAPSDASAVTGYQIIRGGVVVGTVSASTRQFTDTGLTVSTYYRYTVRAVSSGAGAVSPESAAVLHATGWLTSTSWYSVRNVATQLCVAGESGATTAGEALVGAACAVRSDQLWKFSVDGAYLKVTPLSSTSLFWDSPSDRSAILRTTNTISAQKWEVLAIAPGSGTFQLRNRNDLCLEAGAGTALHVTECTTSTAQQFTLQRIA